MGSASSNLPQISTEELKEKLLDSKILFLDVRGQLEVAARKLPAEKFLNIPHSDIKNELEKSDEDFKQKYGQAKPTLNAEIIVYCQKGYRGGMAQEAMAALGYTNVKNWEGGYSNFESF